MVNPDDVFRRSWEWKEIPWESAHLRCDLMPVVVVSQVAGLPCANTLSSQWLSGTSLPSLNLARFYTQIGMGTAPTAVSVVPKTMNVSADGINFIGRGYENPTEKGFDKAKSLYFTYDDGLGYPTIGYGHRNKPPDDFSKGLTLQQVQALLRSDLQSFVDGINQQLAVGVSQGQFDALVSLDFNLGLWGKGSGSTKKHPVLEPRQPIRVLNEHKAVTEENFTVYAKSHDVHHGNKVVFLSGLLKRRKAEWNMFSKNIYDAQH